MKVRASVVPEVVGLCYAEVPGSEADFHNEVSNTSVGWVGCWVERQKRRL